MLARFFGSCISAHTIQFLSVLIIILGKAWLSAYCIAIYGVLD